MCGCNYAWEQEIRPRCTIYLLKSIVIACGMMLNAFRMPVGVLIGSHMEIGSQPTAIIGFTTGQNVDVPLLSLSKLFRTYGHHTKPLGDVG